MKKFFTWLLIITVFIVGSACVVAYVTLPSMEWYHLPLLVGSQIVVLPALAWWKSFFYDLFDLK